MLKNADHVNHCKSCDFIIFHPRNSGFLGCKTKRDGAMWPYDKTGYIYIYFGYRGMPYDVDHSSSSRLPKFRKNTYTMNPSYSRPVSLDPLFSQPVSLCVTCFTPVNWLVVVGRPFSSIWKLFGTMSMPCVVPEMLWSLDELKRTLISEFPILETEEGGFQNIVWVVCWMGWNPVKLLQPASALLNLGNCGPESFSGDFRPRILMWHRTRGASSHPRGPHRTPHTYSQIFVLH